MSRWPKEAGKGFEYHVRPGVPYAFLNDIKPNHWPEAAQDAWCRVFAFFGETRQWR
jgi:dienelactone hydrolase